MPQPLWNTVWQFHIKLNIHLVYDPAIPLLGNFPKGKKKCFSPKTLYTMFIVALFITMKNGENLNILPGKINYGVFIQWNITTNKNEQTTNTTTEESKIHMVNKRNQNQKAFCCMIPFIWHSRKCKIIGIENRSVVSVIVDMGEVD